MKRGVFFRKGALVPLALLLPFFATAVPVPASDDIRVEVQLDGDSGIGKGSMLAGTTGENGFTIPLENLQEGIHLISFRAKDEAGNYSTTVTRLLYITDKETVAGAEYFVDTDPGAGKGTSVSTGNGGPFGFSVATGGLSIGVHTLTVRFRDASGNWTGAISKSFMVLKNSMGFEWFYDSDPGIGKGNQAEQEGDESVFFLPTKGLHEGAHTISFRSRDASGNWSTTVTRPLYVMEETGLTDAEFFIDDDPGCGNGNVIGLSGEGDGVITIPTSGLEKGIHTLTIRGRDNAGDWYVLFSAPFEVTATSGVGDIEWKMSLRIVRDSAGVRLTSENIEPESRVEIVTADGMVVYRGEWQDTSLPLSIELDESHRNCILTVTGKSGQRTVRRIR